MVTTAATGLQTIEEIYATRQVFTLGGEVRPLRSEISAIEGDFLRAVIEENLQIRRTCEIGCAHGLSALHICAALAGREGASHLIIDPNQTSYWEGAGVSMLRRAGFDFFELLEEGSELVLPRLLEQDHHFDLVFIDGLHTFDHTLLDLFYANRLIKPGGFIVVDDYRLQSVHRAVRYVENYPCYERYGISKDHGSPRRMLGDALARVLPSALGRLLLPRRLYMRVYTPGTMIALRKIAEDQRSSMWY